MIGENQITEKIREIKNATNRRYKSDNKEKWQEYYRNYYQQNKEQIKKNREAYWRRRAEKELTEINKEES